MQKPINMVRVERDILAIISRGHPDRKMWTQTPFGVKQINPITWSEIEVASNLTHDIVGNCIAHLVSWQFIESAKNSPGIIKRLFGEEPVTYFWAADRGLQFLDEYNEKSLPENILLPDKDNIKANDILEAVRTYEDSFSNSPNTIQDGIKIEWASRILDADIKEEIKLSASELENMWQQFEIRFNHRGPAKNETECSFRNPVVRKTTIRIFRALDEQLKRKGFPPAKKPAAWEDYYNSGNIELPLPPWEKNIKN